VLGVVVGISGFAFPGGAAEVQACLSRSEPLTIGGNPDECPGGGRLDAISVRFGLSVPLSGTSPSGATQPSPVFLAKRLDQASARIFVDAASQRRFASVLIVLFEQTNGTRGRLFSILLDEVIISVFEESAQEGRAAGSSPVEQVGFAYEKITLRDDVSGETRCFNFKEATPC
jgi:type VI protein secretion system component Hcp